MRSDSNHRASLEALDRLENRMKGLTAKEAQRRIDRESPGKRPAVHSEDDGSGLAAHLQAAIDGVGWHSTPIIRREDS